MILALIMNNIPTVNINILLKVMKSGDQVEAFLKSTVEGKSINADDEGLALLDDTKLGKVIINNSTPILTLYLQMSF